MALNIDNNQKALSIPTFFRLAFRPLFLGGSLFSILAIGWWSYFWLNPSSWAPHGGPIWWHGHEMIFGFGVAIVTGFLLTAVSSWTGTIGFRGRPLAALAFIWLLGRLMLAFKFGLSSWLIAAIDISYVLFAAVALARPIIRVKQWNNLMFIPILLTLGILNATSHWAILSNQYLLAIQCLHATVLVFVLIIAVLGGRVIPAFTANSSEYSRVPPIPWVEKLTIFSILAMAIIALIGFYNVPKEIILGVAVIGTISNTIRLLRWGGKHTGSTPLLWSLHLSYAFIPLGFFMIALYSLNLMPNISAALHCFTIGTIGGMILSMISRVTLGHTGRMLKIPSLLPLAYSFILVAACVRVILPVWFSEFTLIGIGLSGVLWILAFTLYLYFYAPMLVTKRADGQPG